MMNFGFLLFNDLEELEAAGNVQAFAEYYPSGKMYGSFAGNPKAPGYLKR